MQLSKGYPTAAVETLEPAYAFDPRMARQDYVAALLAVAEAKTDTDQRLATYRVILKIEPDQPVAKERWTTGWQQKAEAALTAANYEAAVNAYQQLGDQASINHVLTLQSKAQLAHLVTTAGNHEKAERWVEAVEIYTELLAKFPADESWPKRLATAKEEADLTTLYAQSLGLIQEKKLKSASKLLAQVIGRRPGYKESARYLLLALHGDDVTTLKEKLATATSQSANLQTQLATITQQAKMQQAQIANLEKELAQLRPPPTQATAAQAVSAPTQNLNDPAIERKLALWNPLNHLRLLWWIWQPKALKQFHASLNNGQRERLTYLAAWTISTLSWGVLGGYTAWGVTYSSLLEENSPAIYALGALLVLAWSLTSRYGLSTSDLVFVVTNAFVVVITVVIVIAFTTVITTTNATTNATTTTNAIWGVIPVVNAIWGAFGDVLWYLSVLSFVLTIVLSFVLSIAVLQAFEPAAIKKATAFAKAVAKAVAPAVVAEAAGAARRAETAEAASAEGLTRPGEGARAADGAGGGRGDSRASGGSGDSGGRGGLGGGGGPRRGGAGGGGGGGGRRE